MEIFFQVLFAALCSAFSFTPGPMHLRGVFNRIWPQHTVARPYELIVRGVALIIALLVWIDLALTLTGRTRILH
jgi:hypothetical protein